MLMIPAMPSMAVSERRSATSAASLYGLSSQGGTAATAIASAARPSSAIMIRRTADLAPDEPHEREEGRGGAGVGVTVGSVSVVSGTAG